MREWRRRIAIQYLYQTMKFILLIAAIYNASFGQCNDEYLVPDGPYAYRKRIGIVRKIDDSHQLRGNSNAGEEIARVELCDYVDVDREFMKFDIRNERENEYDVYNYVDHKIGESVWFYGTNLPPNCNDSDDEPRCNIILSDLPSCLDEDAFQKSKTIRQMHYITNYRGSTGEVEWQSDNSTLLEYDFPGMPALISRTASVHFTDQTGKRVACAIVESEEDSLKLFNNGLPPIQYMTKKVDGASLVM